MGTKYFCDECGKEIKEDYFRLIIAGKKFENIYYCPECFKAHWKETKKKKSS